MKITGLETCRQIKLAYRYGEGQGYIVYGPRGWGKSAFQFAVGAEVLCMHAGPQKVDIANLTPNKEASLLQNRFRVKNTSTPHKRIKNSARAGVYRITSF